MTLTPRCCRAFGSGTVTSCFYDLGLLRLGFEHPTFCMPGENLMDCAGLFCGIIHIYRHISRRAEILIALKYKLKIVILQFPVSYSYNALLFFFSLTIGRYVVHTFDLFWSSSFFNLYAFVHHELILKHISSYAYLFHLAKIYPNCL